MKRQYNGRRASTGRARAQRRRTPLADTPRGKRELRKRAEGGTLSGREGGSHITLVKKRAKVDLPFLVAETVTLFGLLLEHLKFHVELSGGEETLIDLYEEALDVFGPMRYAVADHGQSTGRDRNSECGPCIRSRSGRTSEPLPEGEAETPWEGESSPWVQEADTDQGVLVTPRGKPLEEA